MSETPFEQFVSLVQVDQKINALNAAVAALEKQNSDNLTLDQSNQAALEKVKSKLQEMRKEVDSKELEMKTLDLQEEDKKKKLDRVANHREYQSIKEEVDQLKHAQHALEDTLMSAWNQLETVKKESEIAAQQYQEKNKQVTDQIVLNQEKITQIKKEIVALIEERAQKERVVPAEWLEKYAVMRTRVSNPVVPVLNGDCSACFYKVSAQDMQFLRHRKLVQCKDCFRLLYLEGAQQKQEPKQENT